MALGFKERCGRCLGSSLVLGTFLCEDGEQLWVCQFTPPDKHSYFFFIFSFPLLFVVVFPFVFVLSGGVVIAVSFLVIAECVTR